MWRSFCACLIEKLTSICWAQRLELGSIPDLAKHARAPEQLQPSTENIDTTQAAKHLLQKLAPAVQTLLEEATAIKVEMYVNFSIAKVDQLQHDTVHLS